MFERFTDQARRIVVLAQEEARMLNHDYIGSEHIMLALIHEGTGVAAQALKSLGVTEEAARQQVEQIVGRGQQNPPRGHIPFTPRAKKTLELSLREAIALGSTSIGTEHILLGLIREGEGKSPATQVLDGLGVDPNRVRQQVIALVSASRGEDEAGVRRVTAGGGKRQLASEVRGRLDLSNGACRSSNNAWAPDRTCVISTGRSSRSAATRRRPSTPRTSRTRRCCGTGKASCSATRPPACRSGQPFHP